MISKCDLIKLIQYIHYFFWGSVLISPLTLYKPLISLSVYVFIPLVYLSYFILNGKCGFKLIIDKLYEGTPVDNSVCVEEDNISNYWLFDKCFQEGSAFALLGLSLLCSVFVLYPPTSHFTTLFNNKITIWNIILIILCGGVVIYGGYKKTKLSLSTTYSKCN